ncbi:MULTISPECIES: methanobactin [Hyphomicrobiales]|nr:MULTISPECIES: methanobactin [unclassified Methylosinus]MBG0812525.1 methanobactin [Methylosinus sp. H3A]
MTIKVVKKEILPVIGRVQAMCACNPPWCGTC